MPPSTKSDATIAWLIVGRWVGAVRVRRPMAIRSIAETFLGAKLVTMEAERGFSAL